MYLLTTSACIRMHIDNIHQYVYKYPYERLKCNSVVTILCDVIIQILQLLKNFTVTLISSCCMMLL